METVRAGKGPARAGQRPGRDHVPLDQDLSGTVLPGHAQGVHFLVFELNGQFYGIDVEQVEAIVEGSGGEGLWPYAGQEVPVQSFARWIGLDRPERTPSRVLLSRSQGALQGFLVDTPRDIVTLSLESIFPIPVLIRRVLGSSPLWGVGRMSKGLLLLVDLAYGRKTL